VGTIIIHAGMAKAASSTVQRWLAAHAPELEAEHSIAVAVAKAGKPIRLVKYERDGSINSEAMMVSTRLSQDVRTTVLDTAFTELDRFADRHPVVVISSESFSDALWRPDKDFLRRLNVLGARHKVRLAYYLRPQHTAMEAAWRQWGFRSGAPPSVYLGSRDSQMHYGRIYRDVRSLAPRVGFVPRPFRPDLLDQGDIVSDFAGRFLGVHVPAQAVMPANRGLPLDVVNVLALAPEGVLKWAPHDNRVMNEVKRLFSEVEIPDSDEVVRSRAVLQAYCHEVFEPGNRQLISELRWPTREWVPPPSEAAEADLRLLDELWTPKASPAELGALFHAITRAVEAQRTARRRRREMQEALQAAQAESPLAE
jgi:hypothetical protein